MLGKRKYHELIQSRPECDLHRYKRPRFTDEPNPRMVAHAEHPHMFHATLEGMPKWYLEVIGKNAQSSWYLPALLRVWDIDRCVDLFMMKYRSASGAWYCAKHM